MHKSVQLSKGGNSISVVVFIIKKCIKRLVTSIRVGLSNFQYSARDCSGIPFVDRTRQSPIPILHDITLASTKNSGSFLAQHIDN